MRRIYLDSCLVIYNDDRLNKVAGNMAKNILITDV